MVLTEKVYLRICTICIQIEFRKKFSSLEVKMNIKNLQNIKLEAFFNDRTTKMCFLFMKILFA